MSSNLLEEKLREVCCLGDVDNLSAILTSGEVDVNSKNPVNGWTALHWAAKRGNASVARILINHGARTDIVNHQGETPADVSPSAELLQLLGREGTPLNKRPLDITPNYLVNPVYSEHIDKTMYSSSSNDDLILTVRIAGSSDPDFIEVEVPHWNLTYSHLLKVCCEELGVLDSQVDRIRKLPNTRLRKDNDVKRLVNFQSLELVLKPPFNEDRNQYQSILTKNQTVLY